MSFILAFLVQVGPFQTPAPPVLRPPASNPRKPAAAQETPRLPARADSYGARLAECLALTDSDLGAAVDLAENWAEAAKGDEIAAAHHCLGVAQSRRGNWSEAEAALVTAYQATSDADHDARARLGALAGFAALEGGKAERALALLDPAVGDADLAGERQLAGEIELDRARALVALRRMPEASAALGRARGAAPANAEVWLLSAALARRMGDLRSAQAHVEESIRLAPTDGEAGLEAGLIAVLSGRNESARASWESVIAVAPSSDAAVVAKQYLNQLGFPPPAAPVRKAP